MTTVTQVTLTCDVCGNAKDVETRTFGLDGQAYEIDLCRKDGNALRRVAAGYIAKARKVTAKPGQRQHGARRRGAKARAASSKKSARAADSQRQKKGIYVYGILPADIEVAADIPGVGEHPGLLHDVRLDGLAALISEVDLSGQFGSSDDLRTYREILDATAAEVPILPLRFGTVLASEDAVAEELLAANHDEFTAALDQLEGRAEFQVKGRYIEDAVLSEVLADTRALRQAMEGVSVASVAPEPAHELDSVRVAFLVAVDRQREVERVIEDLRREWEGRIDVQLLGPMAAYDFTGTAQPES
jgi:Gas vesicle synthesis protein GvpL/GvpF/Lsr2